MAGCCGQGSDVSRVVGSGTSPWQGGGGQGSALGRVVGVRDQTSAWEEGSEPIPRDRKGEERRGNPSSHGVIIPPKKMCIQSYL